MCVFDNHKGEDGTWRKMKRKYPFMWRHAGKCPYRLLETFWAVQNGYWKLFGKCPSSIRDLVDNNYRVV
jgi:hypothetical protein